MRNLILILTRLVALTTLGLLVDWLFLYAEIAKQLYILSAIVAVPIWVMFKTQLETFSEDRPRRFLLVLLIVGILLEGSTLPAFLISEYKLTFVPLFVLGARLTAGTFYLLIFNKK